MAFIDDIVKFHSFSKSTVRTGLTLGEAVNPSGHTVTSKQVRTDDIPWFVNSFQGDEAKARTWASKNATAARHNDILYYGAEFKVGFTAPKCLIYVSKHEVDGKLVDLPAEQCGWQTFDLNSATTLKNADGKDVIAIHKNAKVEYVDGDNNAATNSNKQSLFVRRADGTLLDHFVAATDQIVGGQPSLGYNAVVSVSGKAIDEGEGSGNYIGNTYAGIVHFHAARSESKDTDGSVKGITVTCFEYIGDKLDTTIGNIREEIQDIVGVTMEGVVASVGTNEAATSAGIGVDSTSKTSPKITFTAGSVATGETKLVTGGAVKTYVDTTALADGGSIAQKITSAIAALGDVAVKSDIKISEIKVKSGSTTTTLTPDSNKSVTVEIPEVQAATTSVAGVVTISDNDAIATTETSTAAATVAAVAATRSAIAGELGALAGTVSSNKTEVDGKISAIEGKLASSGEIGQAIADVKATADSAVQSVTRATGSSTLLTVTDGTDVTISLSSEVATKSDAATAASTAITSSLNGTTAGTIGAAVADAKKAGTDAASALNTAKSQTLAQTGTLSGMFTVQTAGTVGTGITGITITDAGLGQAISDAKKAGTDAQTAADGKVADVTVDGTSIVTGAAGSKTAALTTTKAVAITPSADSASTALATEASVAKALASITSVGVSYEVIPDGQTHTSITAPVKGRIYLEKDTTNAEAGVYIEWMYTEKGWEQIGSTKTDHSTYASTITVNGSSKTVANSAVDLGAFASSVTAGNGVASGSVSATGALSLTLTTSSTSTAGITKLDSTIAGSTSETTAATPKAVKEYADTKVGEVQWFNGADLLSTKAEIVDGKLVVTEQEITNPNDTYAWNTNVVKVVNNEAFNADGEKIATIETDKLKNGTSMFYNVNISEFASDMPLLEDGKYMFAGSALTQFVGDLPSLTDASTMFDRADIVEFIGDLSSLTNGGYMFNYCNSLTTFISDLSSLTSGGSMFNDTNLSLESIECIADTINEYTGYITISWGAIPAESERQLLVDELSRIVDKGWTLRTNQELLPLFDSEKYQTGSSTIQPLDLDSEPQTVYYVVKK